MKSSPVIHPSSEQLSSLTSFERRAFLLADFVNSHTVPKHLTQLFLRSLGASWVYYCSRNLTHLIGLNHLLSLRPPRGLLLASNHRSFFDQYVIACWLLRKTDLLDRIYFPVKSTFFYERPLGVFISFVMSAFSMYPPVFREPHKRDFNRYSIERLSQILQQPGSVVGVHPEGTRNLGDDPYSLLKAQPGVGKLILDTQPTVVPVFINGLGNDFMSQVRCNFDGTGEPIIIVFGEPIDLEAFYSRRNRLRTQKETSDYVLSCIAKLGDIERGYRQQLDKNPRQGPCYLELAPNSDQQIGTVFNSSDSSWRNIIRRKIKHRVKQYLSRPKNTPR